MHYQAETLVRRLLAECIKVVSPLIRYVSHYLGKRNGEIQDLRVTTLGLIEHINKRYLVTVLFYACKVYFRLSKDGKIEERVQIACALWNVDYIIILDAWVVNIKQILVLFRWIKHQGILGSAENSWNIELLWFITTTEGKVLCGNAVLEGILGWDCLTLVLWQEIKLECGAYHITRVIPGCQGDV